MGVLDVFKRAAAPVSRRLGRARPQRADLFDDEFQRKLETLAIVSRRVFAGRMRAERRTKKKGSGIEFADHRNYVPGDDFRYVDWNVYQRFGRLLVLDGIKPRLSAVATRDSRSRSPARRTTKPVRRTCRRKPE